MRHLKFILATLFLLSYSLLSIAQHPPIEAYPYVGLGTLAEKAGWLQEDLHRYTIQNGVVMPRVLLPPEGNEDLTTAHQEDGGNRTGPYLAALSLQYAVTKDPQVKKWAVESFEGAEKLHQVTGVPGVLARSINPAEQPQRHEEWFFFPEEWHQSENMPGYRWLGDPSSDTYINLIYGVANFHDLVADTELKERAAEWIDAVVGREMKYNMRIVDIDGKMTLWGNFSPYLEKEKLNYLLPLAHLKAAYHITGDQKFQDYYLKLINTHQYADHAILASSYKPPFVSWDAKHAMQALHLLLTYEDDPLIRDKYLASIERFWMKEKDGENTNFHAIYAHFVPGQAAYNQRSIQLLDQWKGAWRMYREEMLRSSAGPQKVTGVWMESPHRFLQAYWTARYFQLLTAAGELGPGNPPEWAHPEATKYEGMVLVPAGEFIMGSEIGDPDESPQREVFVDAFYIDQFEVSNGEYAKFDPGHQYPPGQVDDPVLNVSWYEAEAYAKWAGKRLPTEAEWEKAARGTDGRLYPWGELHDMSFGEPDGVIGEAAWRAGKSPYGVYWMAGGAWEWTADWYQPYEGNQINSDAYGEKFKVLRSANRFSDPSMHRCAHRYYLEPTSKISGYPVGFRCVKDVD